MNIKKLFATLAGVSLFAQTVVPSAGVLGATYSEELTDAYNWAYSKGVTTMDSIDNANMYGAITRAQMAKMLSVYAKEVLGNTPDTSKACTFSDIDSVKGDLHDFIIESCQLGIMGQGITAFRPYDTISRAEFGTALSRVLWGDKNEGGTPYYAKHLDALKAAGIMTQIDNPENRDEVRGYVMLMLMRSDEGGAGVDCEDPVVALACLDPELDAYKECPAACRDNGEEDNGEDEVVKSGSLAVSSSAADDRKVVVASGADAVSDLDTLTFSTSEEVTITKVVLEKYGYSKASNLVKNVWLEDENGNEVSGKGRPNDKGLVNLTIKKDYKVVDGKLNAIIVVETNSGAAVGGTLGFKVSDVVSTAKDVDLGNYKAYTYDVVAYDGTEATITAKGGSKDYNYEGEVVEISKFKIEAPDDSSIEVKSFILTNTGTLDIYDNIDAEDVEVVVDGKAVKANVSINKDEEMTVAFKEPLEIASKQKAEVIIKASLNDNFEDFGASVKLEIVKSSDLSATDKNNARITVNPAANYVEYFFKGGKIRITNTKLGSVDASINSTDVLLASGYVTVGQDVEDGKLTVTVTGSGKAIEAMRLQIAGDEYDGDPDTAYTTWTFDHVEISESGKIRLYVDTVNDKQYKENVLKFSIAGWDSLKYVDASKGNEKADVAGSLTISDLTLIPAEGTLVNNLKSSDDVEFTNNELNTEVVFDGTYTADKQDIKLNSFTVSRTAGYTGNSKVKFYLYVDDMNTSVADFALATGAANVSGSDTFTDVLVKAGESVRVRLEAEIDANETLGSDNKYTVGKFTLTLDGEDENDNDAGHAERSTSNMVIVDQGSVSVTEATVTKKAVLRKASNAVIAEFTVKPDGANSVALQKVEFDLAFVGTYQGDVDLYVGGSKKKLTKPTGTYDGTYKAEFNTNVNSDGVVLRVELNDELDGEVSLTKLKINGNDISNYDYNRKFTEAVVWFTDQSYNDDQTTFKFGVDKKDSATVENVQISVDDGSNWININKLEPIKAGSPYLVNNVSGTIKDVTDIRFSVNGGGAKDAVAAVAVPATNTFDPAATYYTSGATVATGHLDDGTYRYTDATAAATAASGTWATDYVNYYTLTSEGSDAVAPAYIYYSTSKYPDMFKIGKSEDGATVQVGRLKNS